MTANPALRMPLCVIPAKAGIQIVAHEVPQGVVCALAPLDARVRGHDKGLRFTHSLHRGWIASGASARLEPYQRRYIL